MRKARLIKGGKDIAMTARNWALAQDQIYWRSILSPDDHERVKLPEHTRAVMAQMRQGLWEPMRK
jgi:hypothetical protein